MYYIRKACMAVLSLLCLFCQASVSGRLLDTFRGLWVFDDACCETQSPGLTVVTGKL